jgi:hypothetical protein
VLQQSSNVTHEGWGVGWIGTGDRWPRWGPRFEWCVPVYEFDYLDLDLLIECSGSDYQIRVLSSPAGQTPLLPFRLPLSDLEIKDFLLRIGRPRQNVRRVNAPPMAAIKEFGGQLFEAVFRSDLARNLSSSLSLANAEDKGGRIRLRLSDCPELADLP